jgi:hypothetical protein
LLLVGKTVASPLSHDGEAEKPQVFRELAGMPGRRSDGYSRIKTQHLNLRATKAEFDHGRSVRVDRVGDRANRRSP